MFCKNSEAIVSFFHTRLFLCVFVATWTSPQPILKKSECPDQHCSLNHLNHTKGNTCLELNNEVVYRCQKFKCVLAASGNDYSLQPGEEVGCYFSQHDKCYPHDAILEVECHTYTCVKKSSGTDQDTAIYRFRNTGPPRCKDYYGHCQLPGETSDFKVNGHLYFNCVCRQVTSVMVQFDCKNK